MKNFSLLFLILLVSIEVVDSVVYSWILSVNPVDTDEGKDGTSTDNKTKGNSTTLQVYSVILDMNCSV